MTEKPNNYKLAAEKRAADRKAFDPMFFKRSGSIGGLAKVKKGFATLSPQEHKELSRKGGKVGKNDLRGKDTHE